MGYPGDRRALNLLTTTCSFSAGGEVESLALGIVADLRFGSNPKVLMDTPSWRRNCEEVGARPWRSARGAALVT